MPRVHAHQSRTRTSEHYSARPHPEFVVLELGEGLGALIIHTDPAMHGVEIEISPAGEDDRRSHKEVLERRAGERPAFTAVFDGLPAGRYTLWVHGDRRATDVEIIAGTVSDLHWEPTLAA